MTKTTHPMFVLAYPTVAPADKAFIDAYRREHDLTYVDVVEPHFTLVFECRELTEQAFCDHVESVARRLPPVRFVCRYAMLGVDHASPTGHVFLVPEEGYSSLSLYHDKLYTGVLQPFLRLDIPFTPHIGIGTVPSLTEAKRLCDELNCNELEIPGSIDRLTIGALVDNRIQNIADYALLRG